MKKHKYLVNVEWTGNTGLGTKNYKSYEREHLINVKGKYSNIAASSDPSFMGDKERYNPEELFLSSIASCHMLWYLHLCSANNIVVNEYIDKAKGVMVEEENGSGRFTEVTLSPKVIIENIDKEELAKELHSEANKMCFIANSCNFTIKHNPSINS